MSARLVVSLLALTLLASCSSLHYKVTDFEERWNNEEAAFSELMDERYPPGAERRRILAAWGEPIFSAPRPASDDWEDFLYPNRKALIAPILHFEETTGHKVQWTDVFYAGPAPDPWAEGLHWDYVFYNSEGQVLAAHRHFLE